MTAVQAGPEPTFGRYAEIPFDRMSRAQQEGYRALADVEGDGSPNLPGPLKIWVDNAALALAVAPLAKHLRPPHQSLTEREREIAICVIVGKWRAAFPAEAHAQVLRELGVDAATVDALMDGRPVVLEDDRERLVYEVAFALGNGRRVTRSLYERAVAALGHERISDLLVLLGFYTATSFSMLFYDVPADSQGLQRQPVTSG